MRILRRELGLIGAGITLGVTMVFGQMVFADKEQASVRNISAGKKTRRKQMGRKCKPNKSRNSNKNLMYYNKVEEFLNSLSGLF